MFGLCGELASRARLGKRDFFWGWGVDSVGEAEIFSAFREHNAQRKCKAWLSRRRMRRIMRGFLERNLSMSTVIHIKDVKREKAQHPFGVSEMLYNLSPKQSLNVRFWSVQIFAVALPRCLTKTQHIMNKRQLNSVTAAVSQTSTVKSLVKKEATAKITAFKNAVKIGRIIYAFHFALKGKGEELLDFIKENQPNLSEAEVKETSNFLRRTHKASPWELYGFSESNYHKYRRIGSHLATDEVVEEFIKADEGLRKEDFDTYLRNRFNPSDKNGNKGNKKKKGGKTPPKGGNDTPPAPSPMEAKGNTKYPLGFFVKSLGLNIKVNTDFVVENHSFPSDGKKKVEVFDLSRKDELLEGLKAIQVTINEAIGRLEESEAKKSA